MNGRLGRAGPGHLGMRPDGRRAGICACRPSPEPAGVLRSWNPAVGAENKRRGLYRGRRHAGPFPPASSLPSGVIARGGRVLPSGRTLVPEVAIRSVPSPPEWLASVAHPCPACRRCGDARRETRGSAAARQGLEGGPHGRDPGAGRPGVVLDTGGAAKVLSRTGWCTTLVPRNVRDSRASTGNWLMQK